MSRYSAIAGAAARLLGMVRGNTGPLLWMALLGALCSAGLSQYLEGVIDVGSAQSTILCNPLSNKIYANIGNAVTIIDGATRQVITALPMSAATL